MIRKFLPAIVVILLGLFVAWPFLTPSFIPTHDGEYHLIRLWQFDENIRAGIFLPRWAPDLNNGFGVPLFNFFYPLPNYVGEIFHLVGFSLISSFNYSIALGLILSGLFFYLWAKESWGRWPGLVGAVYYLMAPYHLLDVYVRGSIGEVWALALYPAVLWGTERLRKTKNKYNLILTGLLLALLILSHNILALIFFPFYLSYLLVWRVSFRKMALIIATGLGLSAFFWLPALLESSYVTGLKMISVADHFPTLSQLIIPSWGSGFSVPGIGDQISFQIGVGHLLVVTIGLFLLIKKVKKTSRQLLFFTGWSFLLVFLLLEISLPVWKLVPGMDLFQFPWRLLGLMILISSYLAVLVVSSAFRVKTVALVLMVISIIAYGNYARPIQYSPRSDRDYLDNPNWTGGTATLANSFNTIWMKNGLKLSQNLDQEECQVKIISKCPVRRNYQVNCPVASSVMFDVAYFPGWQAMINNRKVTASHSQGVILLDIPQGQHEVDLVFKNSQVRFLANLLSGISLLFTVLLVILKRKNRHQ